MADLSDWLGMDRTTLLRNLRPLERDGFVRAEGKGRGNRVSLFLTERGQGALARLMPDWERTQRQVVSLLGAERWEQILADLERATQALNN